MEKIFPTGKILKSNLAGLNIYSFQAPTLQVNIVVSNDNVQQSNNTTLLPQWSNQLTSEIWQRADVLLNVPASRPFRVQFQALYFIDAKAEVSIDDVSSNCGK